MNSNVPDEYTTNPRCDHRWAISEGVSHCCALPAGHSGDTHVCLCHAELTDGGAVR